MMFVYFPAQVAQAAQTAPAPAQLAALAQAPRDPALPDDWSALPILPYLHAPVLTPAMTGFVGGEVAAKRCAMPRPADGHYTLRVDLAVLIGPNDIARRIVPKAINCPTVEQYGAGLVTNFSRDNLPPRVTPGSRWYRTSLTFDWQG